MARVRGKDTKPEMIVRRLVHGMGHRYRLHVAKLPGSPDLVFPSQHKVIFVHGCFWHRHPDCSRAYTPSTNQTYWLPKLARNVERDHKVVTALMDRGWKVCIVWECETTFKEQLEIKLAAFLGKKWTQDFGPCCRPTTNCCTNPS